MMYKISLCVFLNLYFFSFCVCGDVFHEGSKIFFSPNHPADSSYFGYSVALSGTGLIVGAPKATTGVVFDCSLHDLHTNNVSCTPMKMRGQKHLKNGMWFGASLAVGPTGKAAVSVSVASYIIFSLLEKHLKHATNINIDLRPHWANTYKIYDRGETKKTLNVIGACYLKMRRLETFIFPLSNSEKQWYHVDNSRTEYLDYHSGVEMKPVRYYAVAQVGMAVKMTEDRIIIGAPGLLVWSGGIVQYSYVPDESSIKYSRNVTYNPYFTHDVRPDEYFGYSVESGVFEDGGKTLYLVGGPRAKGGFGMVLVFEPATTEMAPLNILAKLEGHQLGSYFGASLCCLDVNADGRIDLLVGAPNYVKQFTKDDSYDEGAAFVYLNKEQTTGFVLEYAGRVAGSESNGAKFGYSIADLGDVDGDGFNDVAISSPWENNGAGVVYIYGGDKNGLKSHYLQKLVANEARGFGFGLTKGYDVDHNNCNDLVIGAFETGAVYMYRCIPTVKVQASVRIPGAFNLAQNATNFTAEFCVNVQPLKDYKTSIKTELNAMVTIDPEEERAMIAGNSIHSYKVSAASSDNCEVKIIEIKPAAADLSKPIQIIFDLEPIDIMQDNPTQFKTNAGRVSEDSNLHSTFEIQLVKECGKDLICKPWLEMDLKAINEPYIPGSKGRLGAIVTVLNKEEPAFGIHINLTLPSLPKRVPNTCSLQGLNMTCNLPSPFNRNQTSVWEVELEYDRNMIDMGVIMIDTQIIDPVANRNISNNSSQYVEITIMPMANITASGKALPNSTVSVSREKLDEGSNVIVVHYFQVINAGPSDWYELSATILVTGNVSLGSKEISGCEEGWESGNLVLACTWSVNALQSMPIVLPLRYDLEANGKSLEADTLYNITSTLYIYQQNKSLALSTTLVLEPASKLWIFVVIAIIAGILLLAIVCYILYKYGFFSRPVRLEHQQILQNEEEPGCSSGLQSSDSAAANEELVEPRCSYNDYVDPSEFRNTSSLPPVTFQGPSIEYDENGELVFYSSPRTVAEATAVYMSLQRQLSLESNSSISNL